MRWRGITLGIVGAIGFALVLCAGASPAYASWNAGNYLKFGVGARALGMGNAFVAVADDATAIYWNPAGITQCNKTRLFVSYAERFNAGVQDQNAGIAFHWRDELYVGFGFIRSHVGDIKASPERRSSSERPVVTGLFEDAEVALLGTGAIRFSERVSLGATVKLLTHELAGKRADGLGVDFGLLIHPLPSLSLGLNAQNINRPRMSWSNETSHFDRIPANFKVGGSYSIADGRLRLSSDLNIPDSDDLNLDFGAEYTPLTGFSMRGGLSRADIGTGASVSWQDVRIDYAYHIHDIGDTHRFSLGYEF